MVVALVKLFVFQSCTIDVFLRYVRIKKFIIIIIILSILCMYLFTSYMFKTQNATDPL